MSTIEGTGSGQKATELLRKALAKTQTEEGRQALREERERQRDEAARANTARELPEADVAAARVRRTHAEDVREGPKGPCAREARRRACVRCERYASRTPEGLCGSCDLAERRERLRARREHEGRAERLEHSTPQVCIRIGDGE